MNSILANIGILAIAFVIVYSYGKLLDYYDLKRPSELLSDNIYLAAKKFAEGASPEEVKTILTECDEIEEEAANKIIEQSFPHRKNKDGGYRAFIKSVHLVLRGESMAFHR